MLELIHLKKTFNPGWPDARAALDGLPLSVARGDFLSIIGANGAGKSTLFNAIAGSFLTDSGRIILDGRDITLLSEHKRAREIGRLFQDPLLGSAAGMSIEENLSLAAGGFPFPAGVTAPCSVKSLPPSIWGWRTECHRRSVLSPEDSGRR